MNEKAKYYQDQAEKRKVMFSQYDDDGNRLFQPRINTNAMPNNSKASISSQLHKSEDTIHSYQGSNVGADEYLYQDAKDRELRMQNRIERYEESISKETNITKMNSSSEKMLRRKMVRFLLLFVVFSQLTEVLDVKCLWLLFGM